MTYKSVENLLDISIEPPKYRAYTIKNFEEIPQIQQSCSLEQINDIKLVGQVLPFKSNPYVVENLINWNNIPKDPIYILNFPQKKMLTDNHYQIMKKTLENEEDKTLTKNIISNIQMELNPQPAGQKTHNIPFIKGEPLHGTQHKYRETVLFFPSQGQSCHAYCTFCFRWPQFIGIDDLKFSNKQINQLVDYLQLHPEVSDVLFTGGDPMIMSSKLLRRYIEPLIQAKIPNLKTIRIGTKSLSYWPYRFITDRDSEDIISLFNEINENGIHLAFMAHFNHPQELKTVEVAQAIQRIHETGAIIRTQSPLLRHINSHPRIWSRMWRKQVSLGLIPYYMFIVRDTGARHYFQVPLVEAWKIYHEAYISVSGISRTVRGPSMSTFPGKIQIIGPALIHGKKYLSLRFLQGRNPNWVNKPFFAKYNEEAIWLSDLEPAFTKHFFFEKELNQINHQLSNPQFQVET